MLCLNTCLLATAPLPPQHVPLPSKSSSTACVSQGARPARRATWPLVHAVSTHSWCEEVRSPWPGISCALILGRQAAAPCSHSLGLPLIDITSPDSHTGHMRCDNCLSPPLPPRSQPARACPGSWSAASASQSAPRRPSAARTPETAVSLSCSMNRHGNQYGVHLAGAGVVGCACALPTCEEDHGRCSANCTLPRSLPGGKPRACEHDVHRQVPSWHDPRCDYQPVP